MRRALLLAVLPVFALLTANPTPASAEWVRIDSPAFTVFGEVGEKRTRDFAAEFERFREALARVVEGASVRPAVPAVVFIFRDQHSMASYRPLFNGKPVTLSGIFAGSDSLNLIMLAANERDAALRTIFHEYGHLVLSNVARRLPTWLNEGLAEYYSTFEIQDDGRRAIMGKVIHDHIALLNNERLLRLDELLAVDYDSPLYNEGSRRSTFYAQSWALVHMLLNGKPRREQEFDQYVRLTLSGRPPVEAWREVFGEAKILDELRRYVTQFQMVAFRFTFDREIAPAAFTATRPAASEVQAALGELRRRLRPETVQAHLEGVTGPPTPHVDAIRGLVLLDQNKHAEALPLLVRAARGATDWLPAYRAAAGLQRLTQRSDTPANKEAAAAAVAALERVLAARPDLPHAVALKAWILGPGDEGLAAMKRARELAPGNERYAMWQAQFHVNRREYGEARALLAPLLAPWYAKETREYARSLMGQAVSAQQAEERAAAPPPTPKSTTPGTEPLAAPNQPGASPRGLQWVFREVRAGERRIEGVLERIECPRTGAVFHVRQPEGVIQFTAPTLDAVEFLAYRDEFAGTVQCGSMTPPDRVYLTFRPNADGTAGGTVVAVEFLPKQF